MKRIVICGGHVAPALSVMEDLRRQHPDWKLFYFGRKHALEADTAVSLEYRTVHALGIPFYTIAAGRMPRYAAGKGFFSLFKIPVGVVQSLWYLRKVQPDVIVSFGGYVSFAVATAGALLRLPIVMHEQTPVMGLANRVVARVATVVCLSFAQTTGIPRHRRVVVTGNPVRLSVTTGALSAYSLFGDTSRPLLYVTGGSLGSRSINNLVYDILPELLDQFRVVHQCGGADDRRDFHRLEALRSTFSKEKAAQYMLAPHIPPEEVGGVFRAAALIISRAGANTVYEIAQSGKPAILIPLPWSAYKEQEKNARMLADTGVAIVCDQQTLSAQELLHTIRDVYHRRREFEAHTRKAKEQFPADAAQRITAVLETLLFS